MLESYGSQWAFKRLPSNITSSICTVKNILLKRILENGSSGFDWLRTERRICYCSRSWQDLFDSLFGLFGLCFSLHFRDCLLSVPVTNREKSFSFISIQKSESNLLWRKYSTEILNLSVSGCPYGYLWNPLTLPLLELSLSTLQIKDFYGKIR